MLFVICFCSLEIFKEKHPKKWSVTINHHTGEVLFDRHGLQVRLNAKPTEQPTEEEKVLATILFQLLLLVHTGADTASIQLEYAVDEEMGKFLLSHVITARPTVLEIPPSRVDL